MRGNEGKHIVIQDRDLRLFAELAAVLRVADREQAKFSAGFTSTTRANVRLLALTRAGLLRRFFLGTTGGGKKALYALTPKGADLARVPHRNLRRGNDETLVADFFVTHQLLINDLYCLLKFQPISVEGARFIRWVSFTEPIESAHLLIPDGYAEVSTPNRPVACFLEVDLGHESRSVWKRKVEGYLAYAMSGEFTKRFGQPQFRTLVVTSSLRRMASLRAATAAVTEKIFWFTTFELISRDGFWSAIWQRPTGDHRQALLPIP